MRGPTRFATGISMIGLILGMTAGASASILIAQTDFEASEGYVAANNIKNQPGSTVPMPDGIGWIQHNWTGDGTSSTATPVVRDEARARSGEQYVMIHSDTAPSTEQTRLRRKYDTSLIQNDRVALGASIRLDTDEAAYAANGKWYASSFNMYLEYGTSSNLGKQNLRIEFARDTGNVNLKVAGSSVSLGQWTDPNGGVCAKDTWLDVLIDADIATSTFDVYMNGVHKGNYAWNAALGSGESLNQIRFMGPRSYTGYLNTGVSIDNVVLTTVPEPALAAPLLVAGGLLIRRRSAR